MPTDVETVAALERLTSALRANGLELDIGDVDDARRARTELADQIGDYLIPRLKRIDAPLLVVLGGASTSYLDDSVSPGPYSYELRGVVGGQETAPATCGGPCDEATQPSPNDLGIFFNMGLIWGR
jgi:hypothetical protein